MTRTPRTSAERTTSTHCASRTFAANVDVGRRATFSQVWPQSWCGLRAGDYRSGLPLVARSATLHIMRGIAVAIALSFTVPSSGCMAGDGHEGQAVDDDGFEMLT